jgi:hypothetical protein
MKKFIVLILILFMCVIGIAHATSMLDDEYGYFGYIINEKPHSVMVQITNTKNLFPKATAEIDSDGFYKLRVTEGQYHILIVNPCGKQEERYLVITKEIIAELDGPWVVYLTEDDCDSCNE